MSEQTSVDAGQGAGERGGADPVAAKQPAPKGDTGVKVRVLVDCDHGKPNQVVVLAKSIAAAAEKAGQVDTAKEAVAYAELLGKD